MMTTDALDVFHDERNHTICFHELRHIVPHTPCAHGNIIHRVTIIVSRYVPCIFSHYYGTTGNTIIPDDHSCRHS